MYKDNSEANKWRTYALERERDELKQKLREQEKIIQAQAQLLALRYNLPKKKLPELSIIKLLKGVFAGAVLLNVLWIFVAFL